MSNKFIVSVANVSAFDPTSGQLIFTAKNNIQTSIQLNMSEVEWRGGQSHQLLYNYKFGRTLEMALESATFDKNFLATNVGSTIASGARNVYSIAECVDFATGSGTLAQTPVDGVSIGIVEEDGTISYVTSTASASITNGTYTGKGICSYQYSDVVDYIVISATNEPDVITLVLDAQILDSDGNVATNIQIQIDRFQISGEYTLSLSSDGISSETVNGKALAVAGTTCADGDQYGTVSYIPVGTNVPYDFIASNPDTYTVAVGSVPASFSIEVSAIRNGNYAPRIITDVATIAMKSGSDADITYAGGTVTIAGSAIATDEGIVEISWTDESGTAHNAECTVYVIA